LAGSYALKAQLYDSETYETESESGKPYKLGIKAGLTPTWIESPNMQNTKVQFGYKVAFIIVGILTETDCIFKPS
jgi:hypothetical protein